MTLRVGIVGGGIGGLTLAVALSNLNGIEGNLEVDIYESAPELTQVGAGITIWPRTWKILEKFGLTEELLTHLAPGQHIPDGVPRLAFQFRKADQEPGVPIRDLILTASPLSFHRANVQQVLLKHLSPSIRCHLSSHLVSYSAAVPNDADAESAPIRLEFADGRTATCDLLVGADGIRSGIRKQVVASSVDASPDERPSEAALRMNEIADPVWSGAIAYRCRVDSAVLARKMPEHRTLTGLVIYCGKNKVGRFVSRHCYGHVRSEFLQHIVAYPILQGSVVNFTAYVADPAKEGTKWNGPSFEDVQKEEMIAHFDSWEEEVRLLVHNAEKPSRWAIHAIRPLESFISASGDVVLLGDAAHAMTPHQGNGAGQAIEDAYILAHLLAKGACSSPPAPVSDILKAYDTIRRPVANTVHDASRTHGLLYHFNAPGMDDASGGYLAPKEGEEGWPPARLERLGETIVSDWSYAWETTAEEDRERALAMLGQL